MIKTGDIFLAEYSNYYGVKKKHYFYCVYTQEQDVHNNLNEDVIGLMITSNPKMEFIIHNNNDYNVKVKIFTTDSYVCCDKVFRFNKNEIEPKGDLLDDFEKKLISRYYKKFVNESFRQLGGKKK